MQHSVRSAVQYAIRCEGKKIYIRMLVLYFRVGMKGGHETSLSLRSVLINR